MAEPRRPRAPPPTRRRARHLPHRGFTRRRFGIKAVQPDDPEQQLHIVEAWTRITNDSMAELGMNGVSVWGNGLIRVGLDGHQHLELLATGVPLGELADWIGTFIDTSDEELGTVIHPTQP